MSTINYGFSSTHDFTLEVDNLGECAIEAFNQEGYYWYYITHSVRGIVTTFTCGPILPDNPHLPRGFKEEVSRMNKFNQSKLETQLYTFLNHKPRTPSPGTRPPKSISRIRYAKIIDKEEAINKIINLQKYILEFDDDKDLSI